MSATDVPTHMIRKGSLVIRAVDRGWAVFGSVRMGTSQSGYLRRDACLYVTHSRGDAKAFCTSLEALLAVVNKDDHETLRAWLRENLRA